MTLFPNFQLLPRASSRSDCYRLNSGPVQRVETGSRATTWMGPPRAQSASATVDLEIVPRGNGRCGNGNEHGADSDRFSNPSLDLRRSHFSDDSSSSSDDDWLGPRREDEIAGSNGSSSHGNPPSQANSSSRNIRSSSNRQPMAQTDGSAGKSSSSSRRSITGQESGEGSQMRQQRSEPDRPLGEIQDGEHDEQRQPDGQSETDQDMQDLINRAPDISPSSSPLTGHRSGFSLDPGCDPLSSRIDMGRINISADGIGMNSDDGDNYDHGNDEDEDENDEDNPGAAIVANSPTNHRNTRQSSNASAIARGESARQALRAARRSIPGPSRLARVLARLRIRPLPPAGPAREPRPGGEQAQRAARSSRFNFPRILRPGASPTPTPAPIDRQTRRRRRRSSAQQPPAATRSPSAQQLGPLQTVHVLPLQAPAPALGATGQPQNRLRRVGRLPERPRPGLSNSQQRNRSPQPGPSQARPRKPSPIAGQPRNNRSRRSGRLPEWRSPPLGSQQGIPYPNAIPGQSQSIPVVPAGDDAVSTSPYMNVEGTNLAPSPAEASVAVGGNVSSGVLPVGDPRHLARAYAGEAVMNGSVQSQPDMIWYTPSVDVRPVPGYFRSQWTTLLGVQRFIYFYRVGSEGANAVLATRLQNPV